MKKLLFFVVFLSAISLKGQTIDKIYISEYVESYEYYKGTDFPKRFVDRSARRFLYFTFSTDYENAVLLDSKGAELYSIPIVEILKEINTRTLTHSLFAKCLKPCFSLAGMFLASPIVMDLFIQAEDGCTAVCSQTNEGDGVDVFKLKSIENLTEYRKKKGLSSPTSE